MGFRYHLDAALRRIPHDSRERVLRSWVQVQFRLFDVYELPSLCDQQRDKYGQHLRNPEAHVGDIHQVLSL